MRHTALTLLAATAALTCAAAAAAPPRPPAWANDFLSRWYDRYNAGDAHGLARLCGVDARFGAEVGRAVIEASLAGDFAKTRYRCAGGYDGVRELGDLAVAWGHESCLETSRADRSSVRTRERWLLVFRRQADGAWLLSEETFAPAGGASR